MKIVVLSTVLILILLSTPISYFAYSDTGITNYDIEINNIDTKPLNKIDTDSSSKFQIYNSYEFIVVEKFSISSDEKPQQDNSKITAGLSSSMNMFTPLLTRSFHSGLSK